MENTENKTDEVEILVNTGYGGFRLPSIAKVWLMQLGYTSDQAMYMGRGDCPRDLPDLVEAFKRYGNDHYSSIEVHTLPRGAAYRIDEYDGLETVVTENDWEVAGAGVADTDFIPPGERIDNPNIARLSRELLDRLDPGTKLEWLRTVHPLLYSKLQLIYANEVPDGNAQSMWDMEIWACSDKGRKALDKVASETLEEGEP